MSWKNLLKTGGGQVASFVKDMSAFASSGAKTIEADKYQERMALCEGCEHFNQTSKRCGKCGCFMTLKAKMAVASCPINKWQAIQTNSGV